MVFETEEVNKELDTLFQYDKKLKELKKELREGILSILHEEFSKLIHTTDKYSKERLALQQISISIENVINTQFKNKFPDTLMDIEIDPNHRIDFGPECYVETEHSGVPEEDIVVDTPFLLPPDEDPDL